MSRRFARAGLLAGSLAALLACGSKSSSPATGSGGDAVAGSTTTGAAPAGSGGSTQGGSNAGGSSVGGSLANNAGDGDGGDIAAPDQDAPTTSVMFPPGDTIIPNPERGFFTDAALVDAPDLSMLRASGMTLIHSYVRLDDYRTSDIPDELLQKVSAGFDLARAAGVKVILRFAYNFGPYPDSEPDAPKSWVLKHIAQLKPLLAANADVIAVVQAGFIGAWGEWHTSTNDLTEPDTRKEILETLLGAVPATRDVQIRYPAYKRALYGDALTAANAFDGSFAARVGHHNDCSVSSADDVGTYPDDQIDFYRDYVGADSAFVPVGGETCAVSAPRSECLSAIAEMAKMHFSYFNRQFEPNVLASWGPCMDEIDKRLGYRLLFTTAELPQTVLPGGSFTLAIELQNQGFAAPFNARPVFLKLHGNHFDAQAQLTKADPRRWLSGASLKARLRLPASLAPGPYTLSLWLPDAAEKLQARSEYALRFANQGVWDEATGENTLGTFEVSATATGTAANDALAFKVLAE